jgi:hypothetical protein
MADERGRFRLEEHGDQWRVVEAIYGGAEIEIVPRTDWISRDNAEALRDRLTREEGG